MNKRLTALLLALALLFSVGMVSALADEETQTPEENAAAAAETAETAEMAGDAAAETENGAETAQPEEEIPVVEVKEASPKAIMFADLEGLVKKNSPAYKALRANASAIDDAQKQLNEYQALLGQIDAGLAEVNQGLAALDKKDELSEEEQAQKTALQREKSKLETQRGRVQSGISGLSSMAGQDTTQLEAGAKQVILGCETVYIALVDLEVQEAALERQLDALDRTLAALRVRAEGGQVSQLQLMEAESGRESLASGLQTLRMNMTNLRMQLEYMLGEDITGTAEVGVLPRVTADQLAAVDLEKDLKQVLRRGADIQAAKSQRDAVDLSGMGGDLEDSLSAAADYGVKSAQLQTEMKFRSLYAQLMDQRQVIAAARTALETEQLAYDAVQLKYDRGSVSHHELLTAADELQTAKEAVVTAENQLFATYNQYNWAVMHGIFA